MIRAVVRLATTVVAPTGWGLCWVPVLWPGSWCSFWFGSCLAEEERATWLLYLADCDVAARVLCLSLKCWSAVCDCGIPGHTRLLL